MTPLSAVARLVTSSPYRPVVSHPQLRRVLPGIAVSAVGGGMTPVAVSWLALDLAPAGSRGPWVAAAIVASIAPGALGALVLGRFLNGRRGSQLAGWDAALRAALFALVPVAEVAGVLGVELLVGLLAVSSVLQAWGKAGRYTMLAELLPREHHLAGNSLVNLMLEVSTIVGPLVAALVIARSDASVAFGVIAVTYAVLAVTYRFGVPPGAEGEVRPGASRAAGLRVILGDRNLMALLALSAGFFLFYGPVTVALPLLVTDDIGGGAGTLAGFYTSFGIGAVVGGFVASYLRSWPLLPTTIGIVTAFGLVLAPLGLDLPTVVAWTVFGLCGAVWGPFPVVTTTLFQRRAPHDVLSQVLAARVALTSLAVPLGTSLGAPGVAVLGARGTLLVAAACLVLTGLVAASVYTVGRVRVEPEPRPGATSAP